MHVFCFVLSRSKNSMGVNGQLDHPVSFVYETQVNKLYNNTLSDCQFQADSIQVLNRNEANKPK